MTQINDTAGDKITVTLSISRQLLEAAKDRNIDLSDALETYLCQELGEHNGPDFCQSYAEEVSRKQSEAKNLEAYFNEHGPG